MEISNNTLRAFAGFMILVIALVTLFLGTETDTTKIILITLAGFLVGGQLLAGKQLDKPNE